MLSPLVGLHFNPPAKTLIQFLPAGTPLELVADPENPYDENAVKVMVASRGIPPGQYDELGPLLAGYGMTVEDLLSQSTWMLGHLGASDGKPLAKFRADVPGLVGNVEFIQECEAWPSAKLVFAASGIPLVEIS